MRRLRRQIATAVGAESGKGSSQSQEHLYCCAVNGQWDVLPTWLDSGTDGVCFCPMIRWQQPGGPVDMLAATDTIQRNLAKLKEWVDRNIMKFSSKKPGPAPGMEEFRVKFRGGPWDGGGCSTFPVRRGLVQPIPYVSIPHAGCPCCTRTAVWDSGGLCGTSGTVLSVLCRYLPVKDKFPSRIVFRATWSKTRCPEGWLFFCSDLERKGRSYLRRLSSSVTLSEWLKPLFSARKKHAFEVLYVLKWCLLPGGLILCKHLSFLPVKLQWPVEVHSWLTSRLVGGSQIFHMK